MKTRLWRYGFFVLAILVGFALALGYGWWVNPVQYRVTNPHTLRFDYQTDYILMVAELYQVEVDLALALAQLDFLGYDNSAELIIEAITFANDHQYASTDLQIMQVLALDIQQALDQVN